MMTPLNVAGAFRVPPAVRYEDERGWLQEWFRASSLGRPFIPVQANVSVTEAGGIRGIHFSVTPQAKYVTCLHGEIFDVVVAPLTGEWDAVRLKPGDGPVLVGEGVGHGFQALTDGAVCCYLLTAPYDPLTEQTIGPHTLGIGWPLQGT